MVTGAHTDRMAYVQQASADLLHMIGDSQWEVYQRAAMEIRYFLQEFDAGRLALPVRPDYRLSIEWARDAELPPEIDQRCDDLRLLLKDPVWPLPWYEAPSRPVDAADEAELTALVGELHALLSARKIEQALALCEPGNRSLDITLNLEEGTRTSMFEISLREELEAGTYQVGPWSPADLVIVPQFDGRRVHLRHLSEEWTFNVGRDLQLDLPIAMALEAFRHSDGWKLAV